MAGKRSKPKRVSIQGLRDFQSYTSLVRKLDQQLISTCPRLTKPETVQESRGKQRSVIYARAVNKSAYIFPSQPHLPNR